MQTAMGKTVLAGSNMVAPQRAALPQRAAVQGAPVVARRQLHGKAGRKAQQITAAAPAAVAEKAEPKFKAEAISDSKINDAVNAIRFLAIDAVNKANSGHPGLPMGAAPMAYLLFNEYMTHNPKSPHWFNRDRFVLSAGHGSMLQYALMHFAGYESVTIEDCKQFRQWHSRTPGHPENFETEGVEVTTGPLGQGIANAVGLALAEAHLGARFNKPGEPKVVDHYTYCILGDGCNMEGISNEAASLAGHWGLGKLIALYDDNRISIDGHTDISFTEDVAKRFEALGWHVQHVQDGNLDMAGLRKAIEAAKAVTDKPSMIKVSTLIGYGSPNKADSHDVHGAALGKDETAATRENLKWQYAPFEFPDSVYETFSAAQKKGKAAEEEWKKNMDAYKQKHAEDYAELAGLLSRELPAGWESALTDIEFKEGDNKATRQWSNMMLNALAPVLPGLIGGSADLAPSNLTLMKAFGDFQSPNHGSGGYAERNLRFGVREHAMGAIANGIALHNSGLLPYTATFFIFTDYMKNAIRMSAISQAGVIYVMTHDSIGLGEDGPTHQPIEQLATYRAQPNTLMLRPGDGRETAAAYKIAVENANGKNKAGIRRPSILALSRQGMPNLAGTSFEGAAKGAYTVYGGEAKPDVLLLSTGSELANAVAAAKELEKDGKKARVVSFISWELFEEQSQQYRDSVLPPDVTARVSLEAGSTFGWHKWVGSRGIPIGVDHFGASAPAGILYKEFGVTTEAMVAAAKSLL